MSMMEPLTVNLSQLAVEHVSPLANKTPRTIRPFKDDSSKTPAASKFDLTPVNYSPPTGRKPMKVSFTTTSRNGNPLHPATHLQLSLKLCGCEVFLEEEFKAEDVHVDAAGQGVYSIVFPRDALPAMRVRDASSETTAQVAVTAWKRERFLGQWVVGEAEGVGKWVGSKEVGGKEVGGRRLR